METYVVRVAGPVEESGGSSGPRGVVHQVSTGHEAVFQDGGELLAFLSGERSSGLTDGHVPGIPAEGATRNSK